MIYSCIKCSEPVSNELPEPVLENGCLILCNQCVNKAFIQSLILIDLTDYHTNDRIYANELEAQFVEIKGE